MNPLEIHNYLMRKHRNVYQEAELFDQNRKAVNEYLNVLAHPQHTKQSLTLKNDAIVAGNGDTFKIKNNVIDFRTSSAEDSELHKKWDELNAFLINYQEYLTPYTLLNSLSIYSYIGEKTGLNNLRNATVVDVGAGTGQITELFSSIRNPLTIICSTQICVYYMTSF